MTDLFTSARGPAVQADIIFGSPRAGCRNLGICEVRVLGFPYTECAEGCPDPVRVKLAVGHHGRVSLFLPSQAVTPQLFRQQFSGGVFTVPDPYRFDTETARFLTGTTEPLVIQPGVFPLLELAEGYLISLATRTVRKRKVAAQNLMGRNGLLMHGNNLGQGGLLPLSA